MLHPESLSKLFLVERGADHAQLARNIGSTRAYIRLAGNIVKVYPLAVRTLYDTLRTIAPKSFVSVKPSRIAFISSEEYFFAVFTPQLVNTSSA